MKTIKYMLILLVAMGTVYGWAMDKPIAREKKDTKVVVEGNNEFALELYAKLRTGKENLFFSPYSISTALAMTYAGAMDKTAEQMTDVLCFPTEPAWEQKRVHSAFGAILKNLNAKAEKGGYELNIANALWGQTGYGFLKEFLELVKTNYDSGLNEVDFVKATESARNTINTWVEKETKNRIKNLIGPGVLNQMTRLVLTNAIYFKGNWASQFEKDRTKDAPFTLISGKKVDTAMMNQKADFNYMETDNFQGLELPYVDNELSMVILLPKETDGLATVEKMLKAGNLENWLGRMRKREVIVSVPKFKLTCRFGLAGVLKSLGMIDAFSPGDADFSGMNGKRDLFISAVIHKAFVAVDEEGTEAAAATGVVVGVTAMPPRPLVFRADHPFVFMIKDNRSGSILFMGRVMNPRE